MNKGIELAIAMVVATAIMIFSFQFTSAIVGWLLGV